MNEISTKVEQKKQFRKTCIFCKQQRKMSEEHVFGDWANSVIADSADKRRAIKHVRSIRSGDEMLEVTMPTRKLGQGHVGHTKCYDICEHCNTGWMSSIERSAKPILAPLMQGSKEYITPDECKILVAWIIKSFMALEFVSRDNVVIKSQERDYFYQGAINPQWSIFLGRYKGDDKCSYRLESQYLDDSEAIEKITMGREDLVLQKQLPQELKNTLIGTFIRGEFFIHLVRTSNSLFNYINSPRQPMYKNTFLERIWPIPPKNIILNDLPFVTTLTAKFLHLRELTYFFKLDLNDLDPPGLIPITKESPYENFFVKVFEKDESGKIVRFTDS